jgi:tRNA(fMet)-specific endonuclease VapC
MARFLLDTNIVSFLVKRSDPGLHQRFRSAQKSYMAISTVTEAELRFGIALLPPGARLHAAVAEFLEGIVIESWDSACARSYAEFSAEQQRAGKPLSTMDGLIAAHALAHDFTLISNDHVFDQVPNLKVEDWTKGPRRA